MSQCGVGTKRRSRRGWAVPPFVTEHVCIALFPHGLLAMLEVCSALENGLWQNPVGQPLLVFLSRVKKIPTPELF